MKTKSLLIDTTRTLFRSHIIEMEQSMSVLENTAHDDSKDAIDELWEVLDTFSLLFFGKSSIDLANEQSDDQ